MINDKYGLIEEGHVEIFERLLREYGEGVVLDLGCAARDPTDNKSKLVDTLICIDVATNVRTYFKDLVLPDKNFFVCADARQMPFRDSYADLVLMIGIYGDFPISSDLERYDMKFQDPTHGRAKLEKFYRESRERLLRETTRVLRPSGKVIASNAIKHIDETVVQFERFFEVENLYKGSERYLLDCSIKS